MTKQQFLTTHYIDVNATRNTIHLKIKT